MFRTFNVQEMELEGALGPIMLSEESDDSQSNDSSGEEDNRIDKEESLISEKSKKRKI